MGLLIIRECILIFGSETSIQVLSTLFQLQGAFILYKSTMGQLQHEIEKVRNNSSGAVDSKVLVEPSILTNTQPVEGTDFEFHYRRCPCVHAFLQRYFESSVMALQRDIRPHHCGTSSVEPEVLNGKAPGISLKWQFRKNSCQ